MSNEQLLQKRRLCALLLTAAADLLLKSLPPKRPKKRSRRWWIRPVNRKKRQGVYYNLYQDMRRDDPESFFNYTNMDVALFDELLNLVQPHLTKSSNRPSIPAECRLLITIRLLASGESLGSVATNYRMGKSTVCEIFRETCEIIWKVLQPLYLPTMQKTDWKRNSDEFATKWNLPNCVGALDAKHVDIKQPNSYNFNKTLNLVLFAVCDANYKFNIIDICAFDSESDGGILRNSTFGLMLEDNSLLRLPEGGVLPYYFVADDAFPLKINVMKPISNSKSVSDEERIYNCKILRVKRCIENALGILSARWKIFNKPIYAQIQTADVVLKATACLHNYIMAKQENGRYCDDVFVDREVDGKVVDGLWRRQVGAGNALQNVQFRLGARNATKTALHHRNLLVNYVNNKGVDSLI